MFNVILDTPPTDWRGVDIKTDFKNVLHFFRILDDESFTDEERALLVIDCFFSELPENEADLWDFIIYFIRGGKIDDDNDDEDNEKIFDFTIDAGRIYAAFIQVYNIDLRVVSLHWWVFLELFQALPNDTKLHEVIEIRTKRVTAKDNPEYKNRLVKLKELYAVSKSEKGEGQDAFDNFLDTQWGA